MWIILAGALAALQLARRPALLLLALATLLGLYQDLLAWPVLLLFTGTAGVVALRIYDRDHPQRQMLTEALLVLIAIGLLLHLFPGFTPPLQAEDVQAGPRSVPFSFGYHFDKALIPFVLLACLPTLFRARACPPRCPWIAALALIAAVPLLLGSAVLLGGLAVEPHFPPWLAAFMLANLFFVSLAEEALFRGYLQQRLRATLGGMPALVISALLFGLAWHWSGRLWLAAALHFALNLTHLLLFTYPALHH